MERQLGAGSGAGAAMYGKLGPSIEMLSEQIPFNLLAFTAATCHITH